MGLIEEFLQISDESLIIKLEDVIRKEKKMTYERNLKPMLIDEFHEMIDEAIHDSDAGRVISHQELSKKIKTWK